MKKKILFSLLLLVLIIPCCLLAGCKKGGKELTISAEGSNKYGLIIESGTANVDFENNVSSGTQIPKKIKQGSGASFDVVLLDYYDADTLKVYANGKEVSLTKAASYDAERVSSYKQQVVATFTLDNVQEDTNISLTCQEKILKFTFKLRDDYKGNVEQQTCAKDLYIGEDCLYDKIQNGSYVYTIKYSDFKKNGLPIKSQKQIGYYDFSGNDSQGNMTSFVYSLNGMVGVSNGYKYLSGKFTETKNEYCLNTFEDHNLLKKSNEIEIDLYGIFKNPLYVNKISGKLITVKLNGTVDWDDLSYDEQRIIPGGKYTYAIISLDESHGLEYSKAKLYVNDTEIERNADGTYRLDLTKMPIAYFSNDVVDDSKINLSFYDIKVTGVDTSEIHGLRKITMSSSNKNIETNITHGYYINEEEGIFLLADGDSPEVYYSYFNVMENYPNTITITVDGSTVVLQETDLLNKLTGDEEWAEIDGCVVKIKGSYNGSEHTVENINYIYFYIPTTVANVEIKFERN